MFWTKAWAAACTLILSLTYQCVAIPDHEYHALRSIYDSTDGQSWIWINESLQWNFSDAQDPCLDKWEGVYCSTDCLASGEFCHVVALDLRLHNMNGTLPSSIGNLSHIVALDLSYNFIEGTIPDEIASLQALTALDMSYLCLYGEIPASLSTLSKLEHLFLVNNRLTGQIPNISGLTKLIDLDLSENGGRNTSRSAYNNSIQFSLVETIGRSTGDFDFPPVMLRLFSNGSCGSTFVGDGLSGTIPDSILRLSKLETFALSKNSFIGEIPRFSIENTPNLTVLDLSLNYLEGTIPAEIATIDKLVVLSLAENFLLGTIPTEIYGSLGKLEILDLSLNNIYGELLAGVGSLSSLTELRLSANNFTGSLPTELQKLTNLQVLELGLGRNCFQGQLFPEIGNLVHLRELEISNTAITGPIPTSIAKLTNLEFLSLAGNNNLMSRLGYVKEKCHTGGIFQSGLEGELPPKIWALTKLETLLLNENRLTGDIPKPNIRQMINLRLLNVGNNNLGNTPYSFPAVLTALSNLEELYLDGNRFFSTVPPEIGDMNALQVLSMETNFLFGTLPVEIATLTNLRELRLNTNLLGSLSINGENTLPVPSIIFQMTGLEYMSLRGNGFVGSISTEIGNLLRLEYVTLAANRLTGPIPATLGQCSLLRSINLGDNRLMGHIPLVLTNLPLLETLVLGQNSLTGTFPAELAVLSGLRNLVIDRNRLHGNFPKVWNMPLLEGFICSKNRFTGEIPSGISSLQSLSFFEAHDNSFFGSLPKSIEKLSVLNVFDFSNNCFSGTLPEIFMGRMSFFSIQSNCFNGRLPNTLLTFQQNSNNQFKLLRISDNFFTGPPPDITLFPRLEGYIIDRNFFSGYIMPQNFEPNGVQRWLYYLDISENMLQGDIGLILRSYRNLEIIIVYENMITGFIPDDAVLERLQSMRANDNFITGQLPLWLGSAGRMDNLLLQSNFIEGSNLDYFFSRNLSNLQHVDLSDNFFSGSLPISLWSIKTLQTVALSNNCFRYRILQYISVYLRYIYISLLTQ